MSDEKVKKTEQSQPKQDSQKGKIKVDKGQINVNLGSEKPIKEGYQPTDKLDTSNPPTDKGEDKTE